MYLSFSALGDEGGTFGTKRRKNKKTRNLLSLALSKKFSIGKKFLEMTRNFVPEKKSYFWV